MGGLEWEGEWHCFSDPLDLLARAPRHHEDPEEEEEERGGGGGDGRGSNGVEAASADRLRCRGESAEEAEQESSPRSLLRRSE